MPKRHQQRPAEESAGRNNPKKSTVNTTGTYKKHATDEKQAAEHKNSAKQAQDEKVPASIDPNLGRSHKADSRAMEAEGEKSLHTQLADLSDDELRNLVIVPEGTRLEQGAVYFDLRHTDADEFVAMENMVAGPDSSYISKKENDYVLWNRIMGVTNPARLDEAES